MTNIDVAIVGAGPTGLLLAVWLKHLKPNINIRIVDKASGPGTTSRALVVHARTLEFYRQIGIIDTVLAEGTILQYVSLSSYGAERGRMVFGNIGEGMSKYPYMLSYPQDRHERLLLKHLDSLGVDVEWNEEIIDLTQDDNSAQLTLKNAGLISARFIAGCDGAHSIVRKKAEIEITGDAYPAHFYVADCTLEEPKLTTEFMGINVGPDGFALTFPIGDDDKVRVIGNVPFNANDDVEFDDIRPGIEELTHLSLAGTNWSSIYTVHHRVASHFRKNNIFILGDAGHIHSPVGGQGMNTGLGDAVNLSWKLVDVLNGHAGSELLDTYETERIAFAKKLVQTTDTAFSLVVNQGWIGWFMRSTFLARIMPLIWRIPFFPPMFFKIVSQTAITYREGRAGGSLKPGDRLPWVPYNGSGFGVDDNYESLVEPCWQVHRYGAKGVEAKPTSMEGVPLYCLPETQESIDAGLSSSDDYLIRPDGHIAMISKRKDTDGADIKAFLRQRLSRQ